MSQSQSRPLSSLPSYIVTPAKLSSALSSNPPTTSTATPRILPLCASWFLPNDPHSRTGPSVFHRQRIPSSRFFPLDTIKDASSPYPHMLPTASTFATAMRELGIRRTDIVVIYDSQELGLFSAPRVGWTFRVFGHPRVHVLDNFRAWVEGGYPVEGGDVEDISEEERGRSGYPVSSVKLDKVVEFEEMKEIAKNFGKKGNKGVQILDARPRGRWAGSAPEPRPGLSSGHIPGSISVPYSELVDAKTGSLLPREELRKIFEAKGVDPEEPIVSSCGTGVSAAVIDMALGEAGWGREENRRLYDGSWTEWAQRVKESENLIQKEV